jgi:hypothetical protein
MNMILSIAINIEIIVICFENFFFEFFIINHRYAFYWKFVHHRHYIDEQNCMKNKIWKTYDRAKNECHFSNVDNWNWHSSSICFYILTKYLDLDSLNDFFLSRVIFDRIVLIIDRRYENLILCAMKSNVHLRKIDQHFFSCMLIHEIKELKHNLFRHWKKKKLWATFMNFWKIKLCMHCKIDFSIRRFFIRFHFHWWKRWKNTRLFIHTSLTIFLNVVFRQFSRD